jgi:hypothetical protein
VRLLGLPLLLGVLFSSSTFAAQTGRPIPAGVRQADQAEDKFEKSLVPPQNQRPTIDPQKLKHDADELAPLAASIPPAVDQTAKGLLPKDLSEKLKRIEKLAKQMRSQLIP